MYYIFISIYIYRCTNADPNYGSSWFYCRSSPIESPKVILERAQNIITHELIDSQSLYNQAILCYIIKVLSTSDSVSILSLVQPLATTTTTTTTTTSSSNNNNSNSNNNKSKRRKSYSGSDNTSDGLDVLNTITTDNSITNTNTIVINATTTTNNNNNNNNNSDNNSKNNNDNNKNNNNTIDKIVIDNRNQTISPLMNDKSIIELIEDILKIFQYDEIYNDIAVTTDVTAEDNKATTTSNNNNSSSISNINIYTKLKCIVNQFKVIPIIELPGGSLYVLSDFVTALVTLNRIIFNRSLTDEERRKVLFGSDQILP